MKIAFIYSPFSLSHKVFNLDCLFDHPQGLTGSESSCFFYALELVKLGHEVSFYSIYDKQYDKWNGMSIYHHGQIVDNQHNYDVIYSWNEPDLFRGLTTSALRVVNQQLNDFDYCIPGYDNYVDLYTSPSHTHSWMLHSNYNVDWNKFVIVPNGLHPERFTEQERIKGRVVYISSPDRGLHLLLMAWQKIKEAAPWASLRIYYEIERWFKIMFDWNYFLLDNKCVELHHRANYIKYALEKLEHLDVKHEGSNSYNKISNVLSSAEVMAYFCQPSRWCEGFSVSTLEACGAGTCPIVSDVDSLGEIYKDGAVVLPSPVSDNYQQYVDHTIRALTDKVFREENSHRASQFAKKYDYKLLAPKLVDILEGKLKER